MTERAESIPGIRHSFLNGLFTTIPIGLMLVGCGAASDEHSELGTISDELRIHTLSGGARDQFPKAKQRNIKYCVSNGFNQYGVKSKIRDAWAAATSEWSKAADVKFTYDSSKDAACVGTDPAVNLAIVVSTALWDGQAAAPYPSGPDRSVGVGCNNGSGCTFSQTQEYYRKLFIHEAGHSLGFGHEFNHNQGPCPNGAGTDYEDLTAYDSESALNYVVGNPPPCVGTATETYITDLDRQGSQLVYGIPWESLAQSVVGTPAVASWASGRLDVFVRGSDNALWHTWFDGLWHAWESLGGSLSSAPAAVSWGSGRIDIVARWNDNTLRHLWFDGGWWGWWESLGTTIATGTPAIASWGSGRLDIFARGNANDLVHVKYDGAWHAPVSLGGVLFEGVSAVSWDVNRIDVFVRGSDSNIWTRWYNGQWQNWSNLGAPPGGPTMPDPTVTSWAPGRLDVFVVGGSSGRELYQMTYNQGWGPYVWKGSFLLSGAGAVSWGPGRIDLFAARQNVGASHAYFDSGGWRM